MNSRSVTFAISIFITLCLAIFVIYQVITTNTSMIGSLYLYLAIAALIFAVNSPRMALYACVPATCYIDFIKRLMIIGGMPTELEVAYVQSIPMILVVGAGVGLFLSRFMQSTLGSSSWYSLIISAVVMSLLIASGGQTGGFTRQAGQAVNMGIYSLLLFIAPLVFANAEDQKKYLKFCFICFIPVALYMIKHFYMGLADFEYDYMMTGLSQEIRIFTVDGDARRYFSTMNSGATVSTMLSVMSLYAFVNLQDRNVRVSMFIRLGKLVVAVLFAYAALLTLSRTGWVSGIVAVSAYIVFGSKNRVFVGYLLGTFVFFVAIFSADYIIKYRVMDDWQTVLNDVFLKKTNDASTERGLVLGTMYDRLSGWRYMATQPSGFPLFGSAFGGEVSVRMVDNLKISHDLFVDYLIKLGWVPLLALLSFLVFFVIKLHKFQFSLLKNTLEFKLIRYSLASFIGILAGGMANGAQLFNFPQNFYFWLWLAMCLTVYQRNLASQNTSYHPQQEGLVLSPVK